MEQIRVLHVDDDAAVVETTSQLLEQVADNFLVETETEPHAVLDNLSDDGFECVVSDYQMPEINGLELLDAIRDEYADLPFILYTGRGSEEIASEAISSGVTDYLQKQSGTDHYEVLANRIETAVSNYRAKKQAESEREQRAALFEHATDPIIDVKITPDRSEVLAINDAFEETFGYDADEVRGKDAAELLVPDEGQDVHESLKRRLLTGEPIEAEVQRETAAGLRDFLARAIPYEGVDGQQRAYAWYIDFTEQKRRERELEESRERYRSLFENNPLVIWEEDFSAGKRYLDELAESVDDIEAYLADNPAEARRLIDKLDVFNINEQAVEYYGAPSKEVLLENFEQIFTEEAIEEFVSAAVAIATGQRHYRTETVTRTLDGDTNHELIDIYVPEAYADDCSRVYVTGMDITERVEREQELERYEAIVENTEDGIYVFDKDGRFRFVNQRVVDVSGIPLDAWIGEHVSIQTDLETLTEDEVDAIESGIHAIVTGTETEVRIEVTPDVPHDLHHLEIRLTPFQTDTGDTRVIGFSRDISERKMREKKLQRQNERFDEFASVVSHDLRNPLEVARGHLEIVRDDVDNEHLDTIARAHDRMEALLDDLLTLARTGETDVDMDVLSLADIAENSWHTVETADATLVSEQDCTFRAERSRLKQLFENLIRNAIEHGGNDVTVSVGALNDTGFYLADDGPGIPEDERDQIFDAGYSTATDGTGFGLSIVKQVVDAHGWDITVTDSDDGGTRFEITGVEIMD